MNPSLPVVAARPREELQSFLDTLNSPSSHLAWPGSTRDMDWYPEGILDTEGGRSAVSLGMVLMEEGRLKGGPVYLIINKAKGSESSVALIANSLRVAAKLTAEGKMQNDEGDEFSLVRQWEEEYSARDLVEIMRGLTIDDPSIATVMTTRSELDAAAAVAEFVLWTGGHPSKPVLHDWRGDPSSMVVKNPHLRKLVPQRPEAVSHIIEFVRERGMHPKRKRDVDELRSWLDEIAAPLSSGWL